MSLSAIGAGFGRTGTLSLKGALEHLGLAPCYHMLEVSRNPGHAAIWDRAADRAAVDWDALFARYRSAVDWPACHFYETLARRYPASKVILTVRDPARWYESARSTIFDVMAGPIPDGEIGAQLRMARKLIVDGTFGGGTDDRERVIQVFERHNEAVKRAIPPERLLVYQVSEGWEPLCRFLDLPVPDEPFPHVNTTDEFRQMIAAHPAFRT